MYYYTFKDGFVATTKSIDNADFISVTKEEFNILLEEAQNKKVELEDAKKEIGVV